MTVASAADGDLRPPGPTKSRPTRPHRRTAFAAACALAVAALCPATADAHGPVAPTASSYLAQIARVPPGLVAKVIDGDQGLWLSVPADEMLLVLDYRGAQYLRFSRSGVAVNERSEMYYLNHNPVLPAPPGLTRATRPQWVAVSAAHHYTWHDGRLHALATVAASPGTTVIGTWRIPLRIGAAATAIVGHLRYAPAPSIAWFWPIAVLLACALAAWRVRVPAVDLRVGRALALAALVAIAVADLGRGLYGRPTVSAGQLIPMAIVLAFVAIQLARIALGRAGYFSLLVISVVALYEDLELFPVLLHGYVLMALPAAVARAAATLCIGTTIALFAFALRIGNEAPDDPPARYHGADDGELDDDDDAFEAWA